MRKIFSILIVLGVLGGFARAYNAFGTFMAPPSGESAAAEEEGDTKMVDLAADIVYPYEIARDSSVICLVGNFIGHHNGAVITCDSAVRYNDRRLECFGRVLINKNDTYIYGDRADYNGQTNKAEVYSPLVKVVDGDATLYTYKFKFDTKLNIGEFDNGGVITNRDNMLEADRGYYYADRREMIGVDHVEMRNDTYQMKGDSVIYNIETDNARFFANTNIWNDRGEYLYADRGAYDRSEEKYVITRSGYILTELREVWSDSLDYYRESGYALLRRDVQIDDSEQMVLLFGDRGEYWETEGNALMTLDPALISYDRSQGDSLFMRADTILMHSRSTFGDRREAEAAAEQKRIAEQAEAEAAAAAAAQETAAEQSKEEDAAPAVDNSAPATPADDSSRDERRRPAERKRGGERAVENDAADDAAAEELEEPEEDDAAEPSDEVSEDVPEGDDAAEAADTESAEELAEPDGEEGDEAVAEEELTKEERKARLREMAEAERAEKQKQAEERKKQKERERKAMLEIIADRRRAKRLAQLRRQEQRDSVARARAYIRERARKEKMFARLKRKGIKLKPLDGAVLERIDSMLRAEAIYNDSVAHAMLDSIMASWALMGADTLAAAEEVDTAYRLIRGYRNVRIFRSDFQAVCDSLSSSTLDSVIRMYFDPVLWNGQNQITSEQTDIHTKNEEADYAEFKGKPMMISKIDTLYYNQVSGKTMYSYFRDNAIYRDDVNGNAQTIYYMQDDATGDVQGMMYITSGDMSFYIEANEITTITYRGTPSYTLYPMDKIPESQTFFLDGFTWQEERRPARDSVLSRAIRPSVRAAKESLAKPRFPIAERIDRYRERLVEQNRWYDRTDQLSEETVYWLDMNTDWREQNERDSATRERSMQSRRSAGAPDDGDDAEERMPAAAVRAEGAGEPEDETNATR